MTQISYTCRGEYEPLGADLEFLHEMGITLDAPKPEPRIPVIATAFYAAVLSVLFYGLAWVLFAL